MLQRLYINGAVLIHQRYSVCKDGKKKRRGKDGIFIKKSHICRC